MKHKFKTFLLIIGLVFGFMMNVHAEVTIKEDASTYEGDVYIIGSSKFDSNTIVTGTMASVAGAREAYVQYVVNQNYKFKPEEVRIYYYSELAESWSLLPATSEDEIKELTEEETKELTENLNIYFVNEEEKVLEVPYSVVLEEGYELKFVTDNENHADQVKYENGKLTLPATAVWVEVYATKEPEVEGEESEELYLGDIVQSEGEFEDAFRIVRTYEELKLAIDEGIEHIQVEEDIDLPTALEITTKVDLYLNEANLTVKNDTAGDGVFHVLEGGDLIINGNGKVDGTGKNKWNLVIFAEAGKVTLNGGVYTNINAEIMEDDTDSDHFDVIYAKGSAEIIINGGTFEGKTPAWLLNIHDGSRETASITVNGGTFIGFNPANNKAEGEGTNFLAKGYKVNAYDGEYTVMHAEGNDVAVVNGTAYQDLQEALNTANNGETVVLVNDVVYENCDSAPLTYQAENDNREAVLDLNGHTVSATLNNGKSIALLKVGNVNPDKKAGTATLTIMDSSEDMTGTLTTMPTVESDGWTVAVSTVTVERLGRLTVESGNIVTKSSELVSGGNPYGILVLTNTGPQTAELTINGGYIESKSPSGMGVRVAANSETGAVKFTMNGGEIVGAENGRGIWLHHMAGSGKHQLIEVTINDGKITADRALELADFNKDTDVSENIQLTINGGEFNSTNNNGNTSHPDCADFYTGKSAEYYNQTFSHVKLTDNR